MRYSNIIITIVVLITIQSCSKEEERNFIPTDLFVRIDSTKNINEVFDFINSYDHSVEYIDMQRFKSRLPSDSLNYALNYLKSKSYTTRGAWSVYGNTTEKNFVIRPRLFDMHIKEFQIDWKDSMEKLKLSDYYYSGELDGRVIFFHVPAGKEKYWAKEFQKLDFVVWTELNYTGETYIVNN